MSEVSAAEHWLHAQGLPWFVDGIRRRVAVRLSRRRLVPVLVAAALAGAVVGWLVYGASRDGLAAVLTGTVVLLLVLLGYAAGPLRGTSMAFWAARRMSRSLDLLLPLVARALPLLLLFMTFLFINTEVWQVCSALDRASLWAVVLLFAAVAVGFLLSRLPEEVRRVEDAVEPESVQRACAGTPLAAAAAGVEPDHEPLHRAERANLVLVLLVAQALQVLLLAFAVFCFFIGFGLMAISPDVVLAWVGHPPRLLRWETIGVGLPVSNELFQVSVFLSGFAGLYFTVYAVSDASYRQQFFAALDSELERAVAVRAVYRALLGR